jgi:hypothetical protein
LTNKENLEIEIGQLLARVRGLIYDSHLNELAIHKATVAKFAQGNRWMNCEHPHLRRDNI